MRRLAGVAVLWVVLAAACTSGSSGDKVSGGDPPTPAKVKVPDTKGMMYGSAQSVLNQSDLRIASVDYKSNVGPPGTVERSVPPSDALVERGTVVTVYLFKAPKPDRPHVPKTAGMTYAAARAAVIAAGYFVFRVNVITYAHPDGRVFRMQPRDSGGVRSTRTPEPSPIRTPCSEARGCSCSNICGTCPGSSSARTMQGSTLQSDRRRSRAWYVGCAAHGSPSQPRVAHLGTAPMLAVGPMSSRCAGFRRRMKRLTLPRLDTEPPLPRFGEPAVPFGAVVPRPDAKPVYNISMDWRPKQRVFSTADERQGSMT